MAACSEHAGDGEALEGSGYDIVGDRHGEKATRSTPVGGHEGHAAADGGERVGPRLRAIDRHTALTRAKAEQRLAKTVLARIRQAAEAKKFPCTDLKADAFKSRRLEVGHDRTTGLLSERAAGFTRQGGTSPRSRPTIEWIKRCSDKSLSSSVSIVRPSRMIVTRSAKVEHFAQVMRNIDDGHAFGAQLAHDVEQALALATRQSGIGLVEHNHAGALTDGVVISTSCISATESRLTRASGSSEFMPRMSERRASLRAHHRPRHERGDAPARHVRHDDILGNRHGSAEGELLIDDNDAGGATVEAVAPRASTARC